MNFKLYSFILIFLSLFVFSCLGQTLENKTDEKQITPENPEKPNIKLTGKWLSKKMLIDGKPADPENYPIKDNELIFKEDFTFQTVDIYVKSKDYGTWRELENNRIELILSEFEETMIFKIIELTKNELILSVIDDGKTKVIHLQRD